MRGTFTFSILQGHSSFVHPRNGNISAICRKKEKRKGGGLLSSLNDKVGTAGHYRLALFISTLVVTAAVSKPITAQSVPRAASRLPTLINLPPDPSRPAGGPEEGEGGALSFVSSFQARAQERGVGFFNVFACSEQDTLRDTCLEYSREKDMVARVDRSEAECRSEGVIERYWCPNSRITPTPIEAVARSITALTRALESKCPPEQQAGAPGTPGSLTAPSNDDDDDDRDTPLCSDACFVPLTCDQSHCRFCPGCQLITPECSGFSTPPAGCPQAACSETCSVTECQFTACNTCQLCIEIVPGCEGENAPCGCPGAECDWD